MPRNTATQPPHLAMPLSGLQDKVSAAIRRELINSARDVIEVARTALETGSRAGCLYGQDGASHQASAPGEPPASDTGMLTASIGIDDSDEPATVSEVNVYVTATADYAAALELGTSSIAPRPFLAPALKAVQPDIVPMIRTAVSAAVTKRN